MEIEVGQKVWFQEEKQGYTVRAKADHILVLTKPFNPKKTVLYTVLDLEKMIRGPEDLIFGSPSETDQDCKEMVIRISSGKTGISRRRSISAYIERVK